MNDELVRFDRGQFNISDEAAIGTMAAPDVNALLSLVVKFRIPVFWNNGKRNGTIVDLPRVRVEIHTNGERIEPYVVFSDPDDSARLLEATPIAEGEKLLSVIQDMFGPPF